MANLVDKLVGYFSPSAGLRRVSHRALLKRAYEAAASGDKWRPRRGGASANADHQADAGILRAKARSLYQNVPYVRAGIEGRVAAIVGTGIVQHTSGRDAKLIDDTHKAWSKICDADGRLDLDGLIKAAERAAEIDGECLIRLRPRMASDGLPVPLQLQLLEIDWLDTSRNGAGENGNAIIAGIEYDVLGKVAAYWLWDQHPGDVNLIGGLRRQSHRVPASSVIHYYEPERPGQGRGFTRLASVIPRVRDLQLYEDAELARKNLETRLSVVASGDPDLLANPGPDGTPSNTAGGELGDLPSGGITSVPAGTSLTVVAPTVAPGYVEYVKYQLHLIATGIGVTYEMCTGDMSEVNFSSARIRQIDMRRDIEQHQWLNLVPRLLDPLRRAFIDAGVLAGAFKARNYGVEYSMPKWDYVNPAQEVEADISEISMGLSTVSEKLRRRGMDPQTVFSELKSDFDQLRSLGVLDVLMTIMGRTPMAANAAAPASKPGNKPGNKAA
jgi:lambda family phage portal protein